MASLPAFEARMLWIDAAANLEWTIDPVKVESFCAKTPRAGFNELIVDVKSIDGRVLFRCPGEKPLDKLTRNNKTIVVPPDYDLLNVFTKEAHKNGLRISAALNVFSEGHGLFPGPGLAYENPDLQSRVVLAKYRIILKDNSQIE